MAHDIEQFEPQKEFFRFSGGMKKLSIVFMALGLVGLIWAFLDSSVNHHSRFWSNLLLNSYYFNGMAIASVFFICAHNIGYGGWIAVLKRLFESFGTFVPITFAFFILIMLGMWFDWHNLYEHWMHAPASDTIVGDKKAFLNVKTYTLLTVIFFVLWIYAIYRLRKHSLASDHEVDEAKYFSTTKSLSAFYIVIYGVSTSVFSWLAVMSLDPHWYSTLFGWYNFASHMCGFLSLMLMIVLYLKYKGFLKVVNESHIHNLTLFLFGFSVFYTYLWFSQFMLIWYGNIPEDTMYFFKRFNVPMFKFLFIFTFLINFVFAILALMTRRSKRNFWNIGIVAMILFFGHYLDFYQMVMFEPNAIEHHDGTPKSHEAKAPSTELKMYADAEATNHSATDVKAVTTHANPDESQHGIEHEPELTVAHLGLIEILIFMGFTGLFLFVIFTVLSKNRLVPIHAPYLEESIRYHT